MSQAFVLRPFVLRSVSEKTTKQRETQREKEESKGLKKLDSEVRLTLPLTETARVVYSIDCFVL